jgi:hypothetical protein
MSQNKPLIHCGFGVRKTVFSEHLESGGKSRKHCVVVQQKPRARQQEPFRKAAAAKIGRPTGLRYLGHSSSRMMKKQN